MTFYWQECTFSCAFCVNILEGCFKGTMEWAQKKQRQQLAVGILAILSSRIH